MALARCDDVTYLAFCHGIRDIRDTMLVSVLSLKPFTYINDGNLLILETDVLIRPPVVDSKLVIAKTN